MEPQGLPENIMIKVAKSRERSLLVYKDKITLSVIVIGLAKRIENHALGFLNASIFMVLV